MEADLPELTQEETAEMHRMVCDMEERGCAGDVFTLSRLATATGNEWLTLVRELLPQWRRPTNATPRSSPVGDLFRRMSEEDELEAARGAGSAPVKDKP